MTKRINFWASCLFLSASCFGYQSGKASEVGLDVNEVLPPSRALSDSSHINLGDLFSAVNAIDTDSFEPTKYPRSLRGTWQEYDTDLIEDFLLGKIKIIHPKLLANRVSWDDLSLEDKGGVSAVSLMYEQNKAKMAEANIITEQETEVGWDDLESDRQKEIPPQWLLPSRQGLAETQTIGCGQFTETQLEEVKKFITDHDDHVRATRMMTFDNNIGYEEALKTIKQMRASNVISTPITIVDHREEPHLHLKVQEAVANSKNGLVFDENEKKIPMSLYSPGDAFSKGKTNLEAERVEGRLINKVQKHGVISLSLIINKNMGFVQESKVKTYKMNTAYSEKTLAESMGLGYIRVPITDHHAIEGEDGDHLKIAFDSQPKGTYVLHHCRGGKGRTQTGMTTRDMMVNKAIKDLSFLDYILRHILIGGANLLSPLTGIPEKEWKKPQAYDRATELYSFYRYIQDEKDGVRTMYRDWLKQQRF